jgi:mono/diheme cytochrome c family protein
MFGAWKSVSAASLILAGIGLCGCKSKSSEAPPRPRAAAAPTPPPEPVEPDPAADARQIFRVRCSVCHGQEGRGDGPGGAALTPKPRVLTDSVWQDATKDEQLREIIVKGGAAVGKSPGMPSNPDLEQKPDVVNQLVKIVRGFKT